MSLENYIMTWGSCFMINATEEFEIKILIINPGKMLALKSHKDSRKIWMGFTSFRCLLEKNIGKLERYDVDVNQIFIVPKNTFHTIINPFQQPAIVYEIIDKQNQIQLGQSYEIPMEHPFEDEVRNLGFPLADKLTSETQNFIQKLMQKRNIPEFVHSILDKIEFNAKGTHWLCKL